MNPLLDMNAIYVQEVFKPQLGKKVIARTSGTNEKDKTEASPGKRVSQAVYDIRYRARREEIPISKAYAQYIQNTTMSGPEKSAVKAKLGEETAVFEETTETKYQIRVTDKNSGKSYVRMATREKMNELRSNPNISSVEMTKYGSPYEGERKKGEQTAKVKSGKGLDPVGQEDSDIDNDGKSNTKTDKYLLNRREKVGSAINKKKDVKEEFSNWRVDLFEVEGEKKEDDPQIKEKKVSNKIIINPEIKESIEELGGSLIEMVEIDEKLNLKKTKMGDVIKNFYKSDAPQFKGKTKEKRREMAVAAKLTSERGGLKLGESESSYLETNMKKRRENNEKAIEDMKKTKAHKDMVAAVRKKFDEANKKPMIKVEVPKEKLGYKVADIGPDGKEHNVKTYGAYKESRNETPEERRARLRASEMTPAQRKAQEKARKRAEELENKANLALAGMKKTSKPGAVTATTAKPSTPEANRTLKTGQKVDTLAMKAKKALMDEMKSIIPFLESRRQDKEGVEREGDTPFDKSIRASTKERAAKAVAAVKKGDERVAKYVKKYGVTPSKDTLERRNLKMMHPGSRQEPKVKGAKETPSETQNRRVNATNTRRAKHGSTTKEKASNKGMDEYEKDYKKTYGQHKSAWD